jgi:ribosomal protein S18 acetylase RimI-like enzyme
VDKITFNTLEHTDFKAIADCFNEAFSDYSIPFQLSVEQLKSKMYKEGMNRSICAGAFKGDKLVGLILHGMKSVDGEKLGYNGGTGVIPNERGQGLTQRMYAYIIPILRKQNFNKIILEVLSSNVPAIKSYENTGFKLKRKLYSYEGEINVSEFNQEINIKISNNFDFEEASLYSETRPSWQHANEALLKTENLNYVLAYDDNELCGYCTFNPSNHRIQQIAVAKNKRRNKIAHTLVKYVSKNYSSFITVINIDESCKTLHPFMKKIGLKYFLEQDEMELLF